ncbi:MAG: hypothetical protein IJ889_03300 [Eubacterium sp.]|nr:hypothetical protein [Eubacterium sp.]
MLSFEYQNDKEKFNNAITRQGEREGFIIKKEKDEYSVAFNLEHEKGKRYYPIGFKGTVEEKDGKVSLVGKINIGIYLYIIAAVLYALIIARLVYSVVQNQQKNSIIAIVAFAIAVFITVFMILKIRSSKKRIIEFLTNLNV